MKKAGFICSLSAVVCCLLIVSDLGAETQTISINFAADEPPDVRSEVEGAAGILGTSVWNNVEVNFGIAENLIDSNGDETDVQVIWESQNTWASAPIEGEGRAEVNIDDGVPSNNDRFLMTGYLDSNDVDRFCTLDESNFLFGPSNWCGANRTIFGGLPFTGPYDVILYTNGGVAGRSGVYELEGNETFYHEDSAPFSGEYDLGFEVRDVNGEATVVYTGDVLIWSEVEGENFTINTHADDHGGTSGGFRSAINAIEITGEVGGTGPPCDFGGDGLCDIVDINALMNEVAAGTNNPSMDLTGDGLVNDDDKDSWLSQAATENGLSAPYLPGDTNLDLHVDVTDLNNVGLNWQSETDNWSDGNLTGADVNATDLNVLALGWQTWHPDAPMPAAAVPEPAGFVLAVGALLLLITRRR